MLPYEILERLGGPRRVTSRTEQSQPQPTAVAAAFDGKAGYCGEHPLQATGSTQSFRHRRRVQILWTPCSDRNTNCRWALELAEIVQRTAARCDPGYAERPAKTCESARDLSASTPHLPMTGHERENCFAHLDRTDMSLRPLGLVGNTGTLLYNVGRWAGPKVATPSAGSKGYRSSAEAFPPVCLVAIVCCPTRKSWNFDPNRSLTANSSHGKKANAASCIVMMLSWSLLRCRCASARTSSSARKRGSDRREAIASG